VSDTGLFLYVLSKMHVRLFTNTSVQRASGLLNIKKVCFNQFYLFFG